jgi:hypothetical protein
MIRRNNEMSNSSRDEFFLISIDQFMLIMVIGIFYGLVFIVLFNYNEQIGNTRTPITSSLTGPEYVSAFKKTFQRSIPCFEYESVSDYALTSWYMDNYNGGELCKSIMDGEMFLIRLMPVPGKSSKVLIVVKLSNNSLKFTFDNLEQGSQEVLTTTEEDLKRIWDTLKK